MKFSCVICDHYFIMWFHFCCYCTITVVLSLFYVAKVFHIYFIKDLALLWRILAQMKDRLYYSSKCNKNLTKIILYLNYVVKCNVACAPWWQIPLLSMKHKFYEKRPILYQIVSNECPDDYSSHFADLFKLLSRCLGQFFDVLYGVWKIIKMGDNCLCDWQDGASIRNETFIK